MKAAYILEPGPAENILYGELPDPAPGPGQLLVRMTAVTTNHIDTFIRSGAFPQPLPRPFVIGRDMVGEVVALGSDVHGFAVGDRVWAHNQGYGNRDQLGPVAPA
jgi:NADPH:quinone reductase-like Zn-dependent oxidoreductase